MSISQCLRSGTVALAGTLVALAFPGSASAAPRIPGADLVEVVRVDAGELCSFPVAIAVKDGTRLHDSGRGVMVSTGPLVAVVTNLATEESVTLNISGPTRRDGGLVGPALILQPASANLGDPFVQVNFGRVTFTEQNTIATQTGRVRDICAELS